PSRSRDGWPPSSGSGSPARSARCATTWKPHSAKPPRTPTSAATPSTEAAVHDAIPDADLGGDPAPGGRLPANAHFTFPGCEGDSLLLLLDAQGIACSTGSACTAGVAQPSHVLLATGTDPDLARGTLRFSLGHTSTAADVA